MTLRPRITLINEVNWTKSILHSYQSEFFNSSLLFNIVWKIYIYKFIYSEILHSYFINAAQSWNLREKKCIKI